MRFLRIRRPDASNILVAGDVLGEDLDKIQKELRKLNTTFRIQDRPDNRIIEITSDESHVAIFFPEKHFLQNL